MCLLVIQSSGVTTMGPDRETAGAPKRGGPLLECRRVKEAKFKKNFTQQNNKTD
jgi:hypothetical protein